MNRLLSAALFLALLGVLMVAVFSRGRRSRGLGAGETVALDDVTLFSETHGLAGRPDRIVREGEWLIPEEWKALSCSPFFGPGETGVRINRL